MRFEPKPDAGDLDEAELPRGVAGGGVDAPRGDFLRPLLFDGMIHYVSTPVEYRLRPRKLPAIDNASAET